MPYVPELVPVPVELPLSVAGPPPVAPVVPVPMPLVVAGEAGAPEVAFVEGVMPLSMFVVPVEPFD